MSIVVTYFTDIIQEKLNLGASLAGAIFLGLIAVLPIFMNLALHIQNFAIGGTSLLIVVGVALETYKQLESSIVSRSYKGSRKRRRR